MSREDIVSKLIHTLYKFHDIPFSGYLFMAPDGRLHNDKTISIRLQRGVKNLSCTTSYVKMKVEHLENQKSQIYHHVINAISSLFVQTKNISSLILTYLI